MENNLKASAKLSYLRIAPRKVRLVADLIRGKSVEKAQTILNFTIKKAAKPILKLLKSAIINAKNNFQTDLKNLYISKITVDEGPKLKRIRPRARGQAYRIEKKTSHITIYLDDRSDKKPVEKEMMVDENKQKIKPIIKKEKKLKEIEKIKSKFNFEEKDLNLKVKKQKLSQKIFRRKAF